MTDLLLAGLSNAAWVGVLAVIAAVASRLWRRRPALAHTLWLLVLIKLVTPSFVHVSRSWAEQPATPAAVLPVPTAAEARGTAVHAPAELIEPQPAPEARSFMPVAKPATVQRKPTVPASRWRWPWQAMVLGVWIVGAAVWWLALCAGAARFRSLIHAARPAPEPLRERTGRLAALLGLRVCPHVELIPARIPPMLWALAGRPRLLLPEGLWQDLSEEQQDAVLAHELAHLKRRDHWVRMLEAVALGLYWWDPIAWWARREVERAEEQCCDALVVWALPESADAYAEALVATAAFLSGARHAWPAGATGAGRTPLLKRRLSMILGNPTAGSAARSSSLRAVIVAAVALPLLPALMLAKPAAPVARAAPAAADEPQNPPPQRAESRPQDEPTLSPPPVESPKAQQPDARNRIAASQPLVREIPKVAEFTGRTQAMATVELRARVSGILNKVLVLGGQDVAKGTVLFEIDPRPYQAEVNKAAAEVARAETRVKRATIDVDRTRALKEKNVVSRDELAQFEVQLEEAQAGVRVCQAAYELAKLNLAFTKVTAPVSGRIGRPLLSEGNVVVADNTVLAQMISQDPILVGFSVDERTVLRLSELRRQGKLKGESDAGMPVEVYLSDEAIGPLRGKVESSDISLNPETATARWRAVVPNPNGILLPGLFARVRLPVSEPVRTLLISNEVILTAADRLNNRHFVFVLDDQKGFRRQFVEPGDTLGNLRVIKSGLKENDWVVVRGVARLGELEKQVGEKYDGPALIGDVEHIAMPE